MDNFREESVSKVNSGLTTLVYVLAFAGMVFFGFFALMFLMSILNGNLQIPTIVFTLVFGGLAYGCFVIRNNQRVEYDYTFTNGTLDIAKVINNSKRKRLLSTDIREFEILAPTSDEGFQRMLNHKGIEKKFNYFLNRGGGLYYGVFMHEEKKSLLVFEPSDEMVEMFKIYNPRNVKVR
ncbi:MAG: hypothetical protein GX375_04125 [Clostridiales bacterium]|nr:hypothetical protein [Clostridiales bacterium]